MHTFLLTVAPQAHKEEMEEKELRSLVKNEKPDPLPVTPRVEKPPEVSSLL